MRHHSRDNHSCGRGGIGGVKQTNTERPATGPTREGLEMAENPLGLVSTVLGEDQDGD